MFLTGIGRYYDAGDDARSIPTIFRHPLRDQALVAVAGPIMNLVCAAIMLGVLWIPGVWVDTRRLSPCPRCAWPAFLNVILFAVFNMLLLPPLGRLLDCALAFCRSQTRMQTDEFARAAMSFIILVVVGQSTVD